MAAEEKNENEADLKLARARSEFISALERLQAEGILDTEALAADALKNSCRPSWDGFEGAEKNDERPKE